MEWNDVAIVIATFVGPIAAVQAQKWLENRRVYRGRQLQVFERLMATRAARLSPEHVGALNQIDLAFYGVPRGAGEPKRSKAESEVLKAWREYFAHLNINQTDMDLTAKVGWAATADALFLNLLEKLALATDHQFDRNQLKASQYSPIAHGEQEQRNQVAQRFAFELLAGERAVRVQLDPPATGNAPQ